MITLGSFLGALLEEIGRARAISDRASVQVAEQYLRHELLKGFPVPRMQFRDVEVELNFAVASKLHGAFFLEDEEVQKSISYQMRDFLSSLPGHRDFRTYFGKDTALAARWNGGLDEMARRFAHILAKPTADAEAVIQILSLSVRNHFHESASGDLRMTVSMLLARSLQKQPGEPDSMQAIVEQHVRAIVTSMDRSRREGAALDAAPNLNILVGAAELEKLNPAVLNRVKITVSPSDRRWVVTDQDGKKIHILGT